MAHCPADSLIVEAGLRMTVDRHAILALFFQPRTWNAREIRVQTKTRTLSTVYRNLDILEKYGFIVPVLSLEEDIRYERALQPHHDHTQCEDCKSISCIPCPAKELDAHTLFLQSICQLCAKKS
ncbi:transcriptional repressor [Candidatus Uhrbacteria bacterium]|nr:transcriptional repressor [Candidatus Uhrbacteria bacterium]